MTLRPGTGSHNRADGNPGVLYIGDVGWRTFEDLNVATGPGLNFGWPLYEGLEALSSYRNSNVGNPDAPNPLSGSGGCTQPYFYFRNLLIQDSLHPPTWPNPCNTNLQVPASIPRFVHTRPAIDWKHETGPARTGIYTASGNAAVTNIGGPGSPVSGPQFGGTSSIGGTWYVGNDFPATYQNTYFHGDYEGGWIRNFTFNENQKPVAVREFLSGGGGIVDVATHPVEGGLYYVSWTNGIRRIRYTGGGNQPPIGVPTAYTITLTVTDNSNATAQATRIVSVNNTPPSVTITSPTNGMRYPLTSETTYQLSALVSDHEQGPAQLTCEWQTILHHNNHVHTDPVDTNCTTTTVISPLGCDGETYYYSITLRVTDAAGLATTQEVRLFPDCQEQPFVLKYLGKDQTGAIRWQLTGDPTRTYRVDGSTNLAAWIPVTTLQPATGLEEFNDSAAASSLFRFYRAVLLP